MEDKLVAAIKNLNGLYKALAQKVKSFDERKNMDNFHDLHFNNTQYLINEIESLKIRQIKNENEIVELHTFTRNLVSFYESKNKPVNRKNDESVESVQNKRRCHYWNDGYCRSKSSCLYLHPKTLCEDEKCVEQKNAQIDI